MKKIMNQPTDVLAEMIRGIVQANESTIEQVPNTFVVKQKELAKQVSLISGGGSGHEPAHAGFVGEGMLQAAVCGQVFTSPTPDQIYEGMKNYSGDIMNFEMAKELAELDGIEVGTVVVDDDIAVEDSTFTQGKRGVAGTVFVHKILGAAAKKGLSLDELVALGNQVVRQLKTISVALSGATVPEVGSPGFTLTETDIEFGVGIHGEPGYARETMCSSNEIAQKMIEKLEKAFSWENGEKFAVMVNGLGGTPLMEQYIFYQDVRKHLDRELDVVFSKVGNFMTAIDMAGISLTLLKLEPEWVAYLTEPVAHTAW